MDVSVSTEVGFVGGGNEDFFRGGNVQRHVRKKREYFYHKDAQKAQVIGLCFLCFLVAKVLNGFVRGDL
jgi:hypothetical protein